MNEQLRQRLLAEFPHWHQQPLRLTLTEMQNPQTVLAAFFDFYSLQQIRVCLKYWLDDAMNNNHAELNNHVTLYDNVEKLVEAAWLIHQNNLQKDNNNQEQADQGTENKQVVSNNDEEWQKINEFFYLLQLDEACNDLWEMTKRALTNQADETDVRERNRMLCLYENTITLYKAVHALLQVQN